MPGPPIRTDIVEVYVFRAPAAGRSADAQFLQLRRAAGAELPGTWQPVMGHLLQGERAAAGALRELAEETGLPPLQAMGFWQLEELNTFFFHAAEAVVMSPGFAVRVEPGWEPVLNHEHDAHRWVKRDAAERAFLWPGQRHAIEQVVRDVLAADSMVEPFLRIDPRSVMKFA